MLVFLEQFFTSSRIAEAWTYIFNFLGKSPVGVFMSMCLVSFIVYLIARVLFE